MTVKQVRKPALYRDPSLPNSNSQHTGKLCKDGHVSWYQQINWTCGIPQKGAAAFGLSNDATRTRFSHLFLNVVDNPAARVRPPNVDALRWRQAINRAGAC